jgi:hypothetical protein
MSYRPFDGHGQGQQGSQQPLPGPGMNPPSSYVPNGYQQFTSPQQQQQQYYTMPQQQGQQQQQQQQQAYLQQQHMAQYGGMQTAYQGYETGGNAFGGHQMQPAAAQYTPPANVWQHQQAPGGQNMMYQQQQQQFQQPHHQQQQMYQRHVASPQQHVQQRRPSQVSSPLQRAPSIPQNQEYRLPQAQQPTQNHQFSQQHTTQHQYQQQQQQQQQRAHAQQQVHAQAQVSQHSPQPRQKQISSPAQPQVQQQAQHIQQPRQEFQQQPQETVQHIAQTPVKKPIAEITSKPTPEPVQQPPLPQSEPQQMNYVNLQDIQQLPPLPPVNMGQAASSSAAQPEKPDTWTSQHDSGTINPSDIMLGSPQVQHFPPPQPQPQPPHQQQAQTQPQNTTPRIKPSPLSSVANSPAISARSPSITKRSPASTHKPRPVDNVHIMVAVAEECFDKARGSVHDVAMSLDGALLDEYQKLISTGLACLEACLQSNRLSPRQEAKMRLRYATVLLEETENSMEAETAITKGISLCEKVSDHGPTFGANITDWIYQNGLADLKYCMHYIRLKLLFQRNHKAALNATDRQIADCET